MPAVFVGHGSPMLALEDSSVTRTLARIGQQLIQQYGRPKAILMVSAHWYESGNRVQTASRPRQVFDMYGFPPELYDVKYEVDGCRELSDAVLAIKGLSATADDSWGIDHGSWTPLVHMFSEADIPVVQLSVNRLLDARGCYELGSLLSGLRNEGYLLMGSGNVVHNLRKVEWDNPQGTPEAEAFNGFIVKAVERRDDETVIHFDRHPNRRYAVPTPDHYLPLLYMLGASKGEQPQVFNKQCNLGSMAMTGFWMG